MGYLARAGSLSPEDLRRAMVYGSAMGSFAVEAFSVRRLIDVPVADIERRVTQFREITAFETHVGTLAGS
jgi:hypothetical protein